MPRIIFLPDNREEEAATGETILEAAQRSNVPLIHVCAGNGRCSTCRVRIVDGLGNVSPRSGPEKDIAEQMAFAADIRLACQTEIMGDTKVRRLVLDEEDADITSLLIRESGENISGVEKEVLILVADIRNFTSFAENLLPYDIIHILNRYFHMMNEVVIRHGGRIDNYMGDGLIALFEVKNRNVDTLRGIKAAIEMLDAVKNRIQPYAANFLNSSFRIGIGLHYGLVVAGTIGGRDNSRQTIIGDPVNFASRIESTNRKLGTDFLISEDVYSLVKNKVRINRTHKIRIRGKKGVHNLYEVVGIS
jgi:adenylate cyclase